MVSEAYLVRRGEVFLGVVNVSVSSGGSRSHGCSEGEMRLGERVGVSGSCREPSASWSVLVSSLPLDPLFILPQSPCECVGLGPVALSHRSLGQSEGSGEGL